MTTPSDPSRPSPPTVREIAELTARLRDMSARAGDVDPAERARFLADKDVLIGRITHSQEHGRDAGEEVRGGGHWSVEAPGGHQQVQMPGWKGAQAARVEAELAARTAVGPKVAVRPGDPVEVAERIGALRAAAGGPGYAEEALSHNEAVDRLTELGHDRASAQTMLREYLDDTSRAVGVSVHQWGLDGSDVAAIAHDYSWVQDGAGQTLAGARERAGEHAQYWTEQAATTDPRNSPREAEQVEWLAAQWTERARVPAPFTRAELTDDDTDDTDDVGHRDLDHGYTQPGAANAEDRDQVYGRWLDERHEPRQLPSDQAQDRGTDRIPAQRADGDVIDPEQGRREQLTRWHADDHAGDTRDDGDGDCDGDGDGDGEAEVLVCDQGVPMGGSR